MANRMIGANGGDYLCNCRCVKVVVVGQRGRSHAGSDVYWRASVWCVRVWVQCVFTGGLGHVGRSIVNGSIATTV